ncbi:thiamine phosphate synthase, partial [Eggerthella lenta]
MFACEPSAADPTFRRVFVTDRLRCALPLPQQTAFLAESGAIDAVILREKDLDDAAYELLAAEMAAVCARCGIAFVAHAHVEAARRLGCAAVHLPLPLLRAQGRPDGFAWVGTNVHEADEVAEAEVLGADVLVASPVFAPSCKPASTARGLPFLRAVLDRA